MSRLPTVAIVGPDGAGKTAVAKRLPELLPMPARYLYMGWNYDASNVLLPTNRLMRRLRSAGSAAPAASQGDDEGSPPIIRQVAAVAKLLNLVAEAWYRQIVANRWSRQGCLVIFDRHFAADFPDSRGRGTGSILRRIRHAILRHAVRPPAILIYLDASPETLLRRKGEGTLESLQRQRDAYRQMVARHARAAEISAVEDLAGVSSAVASKIIELVEGSAPRA